MDGEVAKELLNDENVKELLELLQKYKQREQAMDILESVEYVQQLENTLTGMMEQLTNMRVELNNMRVQNQYLLRKADWTVKGTLVESVEKMEVRVQELHRKLDHAKEQIKENAKNTLDSIKMYGKKSLKKVTDVLGIRDVLQNLCRQIDRTLGMLDALTEDVEQCKVDAKQEEKNQDTEQKEQAVTSETLGTYQEEMEKFMASQVSEGIHYETNAEAFEDFKQYYDKRLKVAEAAGKQREPKVIVEDAVKR
ncbi:MAG: hypothetical protein NC412_05895 [Roseburia sp.]|nr:hypothetical protein [Roseburia sp.]